MTNLTEIKKAEYIRKGIESEIEIDLSEKPTHYFLGSSDRKGYTVQCTATYMNHTYSKLTNIEPFYSNVEKEQIMKKVREEAIHKIAEQAYNELYK